MAYRSRTSPASESAHIVASLQFSLQPGVLSYPVHGKPSTVSLHEPRGELLDGLPSSFQVGRYHSGGLCDVKRVVAVR
jgi:anthranilate/para-aminobenzoate synthase component II